MLKIDGIYKCDHLPVIATHGVVICGKCQTVLTPSKVDLIQLVRLRYLRDIVAIDADQDKFIVQ